MAEDPKKPKSVIYPGVIEDVSMENGNGQIEHKGFSGFQRRSRIGDALVTAGKITEEQLMKALDEQKKTKERIGKVLVSMNLVTEDDVVEVLKKQLGLELFLFKDKIIPNEVLDIVPPSIARKHLVVPIDVTNDKLKLAMADPINVFAIDDVKIITGMNIVPFIAKEEDVKMAISRYYPDTGLDDIVKTISDEKVSTIAAEDDETSYAGGDEGPVMRIVNSLISEAFKQGASDIHVEPRQDFVIVRFRVDGILIEQMKLPRNLRYAIASRFKVMSNMDIAEKRVPQDGRIQIIIENEELDLRVSTLPTIYGEKVVCRLLVKKGAKTQLEQLGFLPEIFEQWKRLLEKPYGIILVTGPTGSGKTRTLYSSLNRINDPAMNIITVEDPVEYRLDGINQVQTNPKAGLTFANGLRSILRQDPDIIMVGEIRDGETADIAINAALTGHLVLSTLHTNDSCGAPVRLVDMGVEPFLVSSSILGVLAQRLVRMLCKHCRKEYMPDLAEWRSWVRRLGPMSGFDPAEPQKMYHPVGCQFCHGSGYTGRTGIFEIMITTEEIRKLINARATSDQIIEVALRNGMRPMIVDGAMKAGMGVTTMQEVMRVSSIAE